jgi:hypothetical protein
MPSFFGTFVSNFFLSSSFFFNCDRYSENRSIDQMTARKFDEAVIDYFYGRMSLANFKKLGSWGEKKKRGVGIVGE